MSKNVCVIIGHGGNDCGAINPTTKETELGYNTDLADKVKEELLKYGYNVDIYNRGYNSVENVSLLNKKGYDLLISLHCNAYNGYAHGTEVLYWNTSKKGQVLAQALQESIVDTLGLTDRGLKPIKNGDRGAYLLRKTNAPCVIIEPFFIDNDNDFNVGKEKKDEYVQAIVNGINKYFQE